jgi:hypothetical protein
MSTNQTSASNVYQFIVLPKTGTQVCRSFPLPPAMQGQYAQLSQTVEKLAKAQSEHEIVGLVEEHAACDRDITHTPWVAVDVQDYIFFRLTQVGNETQLDLIVDTMSGAGAMALNKVPISLQKGVPKLGKAFGTNFHLADVFVEEHLKARNEIGSLIVDFGNSGTAFVFSREGAGPREALLIETNNPFDPDYQSRPEGESNILKSNMIVLRAGNSETENPWIVLGTRAEELIQQAPLATYLYAPKKYVRHWPEHLKAEEPTMPFQGLLGQRDRLRPVLDFVRITMEQMFQYALAAITNPLNTSHVPEFYPQIARVMLTYPLTWRKVDQELFRDLVESISRQLFVHEDRTKSQFTVELICSEPMAVAAFVLWENFFHFDTHNLRMAASTLGNTDGNDELRMLIVDMGGGSTDIACIDIKWGVREEDNSVDVTFKMIESMRFNRAGDRLSHLVATAIMQFLKQKYSINESLSFKQPSRNAAFTRNNKRKAVSFIAELVEKAKVAISSEDGVWKLEPRDEHELLRPFEPLVGVIGEDKLSQAPFLKIDHHALEEWVQGDRQSLETNGEPGFMDIFLYLEELQKSLKAKDRAPHVVVLSGRSTRMPFIRYQTAKHLGLPLHRIRTLSEILPDSLKLHNHENMDKLAVVLGAQRFRFGDHIRFVALEDEPIFNRLIGTVRETPNGLKLNRVHVEPGDSRPRTITVSVDPEKAVRIGHAFRADGVAQVIANLSNKSRTQRHEVKIKLLDDFSVEMRAHEDILLAEWVPGGNEIIVDNFNDTGELDSEPESFMTRIVARNESAWIRSEVDEEGDEGDWK